LKDLEAFAFRGIPELRDAEIKGLMAPSLNPVSSSSSSSSSSSGGGGGGGGRHRRRNVPFLCWHYTSGLFI
jgi:hypothetical protein